ncbi:Rhodanese domain-containing protein [Mycena chlorophos]|uniref:M-phase inducer phosphatase n=1 Tax=Mycena chlorophos TaxID=658473 RepID=A0A8H6WMI4_MYCCL|nr:Rhodanese domain-containing protein [Mycena chlorophos]
MYSPDRKRRRISVMSFSGQFLSAPPRNNRPQHVSHDDDDLESSFMSNVSLNSPPRNTLALTPDSESPKPMDISPAPPPASKQQFARPRAFTSGPRMFGHDRSNESRSSSNGPSPSLKSGTASGKRIQRSALPFEWMASTRAPEVAPEPIRFREPSSDDAMDVDSSFEIPSIPQSAAPTITGFNNLFYDSMSPEAKKPRRSLSPGRVAQDSSSPAQFSSPSQLRLERMSNPLFPALDKPRVEGLGAPPSKRSRRPALSTMAQTAYPTLDKEPTLPSPADRPLPPARRAFSALISGSAVEAKVAEQNQSSDESSFEGLSSPAQAYAARQQMKTIRRCDGTDDFRPLTGVTALVQNESPSAKFLSAGMPGFGDNEAAGKILPCHRVTDDGLMRINAQTLNNLLDGHYSEHADYYVIDCRFDYEFNGGHINGAVNLNTVGDVEEFFLRPALKKPKPSVSGDPARKTVVVFHCEFSVKRGPTFAKHLRAKDRAHNNHVYPKIHYPEIYILEGGYCNYFQSSSLRCNPQGYVPMDDPLHAASRDGGLDQLRKTKFGRHKSYAYGDGASKIANLPQPPKRNTIPAGPGSIFAAASAARTRRGGSLTTLAEDGNATADADDTDVDLGDSPCPAPPKATKKPTRTLVRAETFAGATATTRMPY